jgi:hypothetical protein
MSESKRRCGYLAGVAALGWTVLLGGCFVPIKYQASLPREVPPGSTGKTSKETIRLELPELTLSAQVQSYDWGGTYLLKPLGVWVELDASDGRFTLDARHVTLESDEGGALQPVSFLGPANSWHSPRAFAAGCGPRIFRSGIAITNIGVSQESVWEANEEAGIFRPSVGAVPFEGKKCFMFWFDTDPLPDHLFTLSLHGISRDGKRVSIPEIHFEKGSVWTIRGFP